MRYILTVFILLSSLLLFAEELTLLKSWQILEENNHKIKEFGYYTKASEQNTKSLKSELYPKLSFGSSYQYISETAKIEIETPFGNINQSMGVNNRYDFCISAQQPIFTGKKIKNSVQLSENEQEISKSQEMIIKNNLKMQVAQIYCELEKLAIQEDILSTSINQVQTQLLISKNMLEAEQIIPLDTLIISNRELKLITQKRTLTDLFENYNQFMKEILFIDNDLTYNFNKQKKNLELQSLNYYEQLAIKNRTELKQQDFLIYKHQITKRIIKSDLYPHLFAFGEYHYGNPGIEMAESSWNDYYTVGIKVKWEFWDSKQTASQIKRQKYISEAINDQKKQLENSILTDVRNNYRNVKSLINQKIMQIAVLEKEKLTYAITENLFQEGTISANDLNIAEEKVTTSKLEVSEIESKIYLEYYRLLHSIGCLEEKWMLVSD